MGKIHKKRLSMRYDFTTGSYRGIIQRVLQYNTERIQDLTLRMFDDFFSGQNARISDTSKRMNLPEIRVIKPTHQFNRIKSTETGNFITDELKRILNSRLTGILNDSKVDVRTGVRAGTTKQNTIKQFQDETKRIFKNYTKIDKVFGVPKNCKGIATTALRTASNESKHDYFREFIKQNKDSAVMKRWIHNARLSKVPREHHRDIAKRDPIMFQDMFILNSKDKKVYKIPHPHWTGLPIGEKINCNCEVQYLIKRA